MSQAIKHKLFSDFDLKLIVPERHFTWYIMHSSTPNTLRLTLLLKQKYPDILLPWHPHTSFRTHTSKTLLTLTPSTPSSQYTSDVLYTHHAKYSSNTILTNTPYTSFTPWMAHTFPTLPSSIHLTHPIHCSHNPTSKILLCSINPNTHTEHFPYPTPTHYIYQKKSFLEEHMSLLANTSIYLSWNEWIIVTCCTSSHQS